ncbi:hypothetical protein Poly30_29980 [Planctomycetes bacterium Poly30]|uniref:Uncharacterized protein n=1 Tax=Saltatorellus ferox TaxID=2528018 RepID=A0A518ETR5_9BACT|nr:hypothetical protein Poly30_29980 [Planctomycetes bacterium Poly30]
MRGFLILCAFAALAPIPRMASRAEPEPPEFPGWPAAFEGEVLERLPAIEGDETFADRLEGRMARFRAGDSEIVLRWTWRLGMGLHTGRYCYRALGYSISPEHAQLDARGQLWSCFRAERDEERLVVRERVHDEIGQSWPEVSAWFWDACRGRTDGPWWSALVVKRAD